MSADREHEVMSRIERAKAQLLGTGELSERVGGGRAPSRSDAFKRASAEIHAAEQARNRLLVDLIGDADSVPLDLAQRLGLTGREAAHILDTARRGTGRMRAHVFGALTARP
ncbi:hypothetical protein [Nocardia nova]